MAAGAHPPSRNDVAIDWLLRRDAGLSAEEERELARWLAADERHRAAFDEAAAFLGLVQQPRAPVVLASLAQRERRRRRRRGLAAAGVAVLLLGAVTFLGLRGGSGSPAPAVAVSPDRRALADGSTIELNADAEIVTDLSTTLRAVTLVGGEALFTVAKDPRRPFVVRAGGVEVQAVGTAFAVALRDGQVEVWVTEGRVALRSGDAADRNSGTLLEAGRRAVLAVPEPGNASRPADAPRVTAFDARQAAEALAWRDKRVEFTRAPLAEALAVFNRGNVLQLTLADPALGAQRVSGIFWSDNPESFARLLELSFNVEARTRDGRIELHRAR